MTKPFVIAIDGPAASGKGTLARLLAEKLGFAYLDTGAVYRLVAKEVIDNNTSPEDAAKLVRQNFELGQILNPAIRTEDVSAMTSKVSAIPEVREILKNLQRDFAVDKTFNGTVLDGRDIGTIICPDADLKLYVTASTEIRAKRRHAELSAKGLPDTFEAVLADMKARDERDSGRAVAPLKPAPDAVILDTSTASAGEVLAQALSLVTQKRAKA